MSLSQFHLIAWQLVVCLVLCNTSLSQQQPGTKDEAERLFRKGRSLQHEKKHLEAIEVLTEALQTNPSLAVGYAARATSWLSLNNYAPAIQDWNQVIELDSQSAVAYLGRAKALHENGQSEQALADLKRTIELKEDTAAAYGLRAIIYFKVGEFDQALTDCHTLIGLEPQKSDWYILRAGTWVKLNNPERAVLDLDEAISLAPEKSKPYVLRGKVWEAMRWFHAARKDYKIATQVDPKEPAGFASLAFLLATCPDQHVRDPAVGIQHAQRCCELMDEQEWRPLALLATAFAENGDFEKAVQWQEKAIELAPDDQRQALEKRSALYRSGKSYYQKRSSGLH